MKAHANLTALVVEPNMGTRAMLHKMLNQCGITKVDHAVSSGTAIRQIERKSFDVILCEYDLGEGQDGQQLLEDLRHNQLLSPSAIFIMVTLECGYGRVVSTAEFAPSDYILKPFAADTLLERITRALEKRAAFFPVFHLMAQANLREAILTCSAGEEKFPQYAVEFMRLRAELHISLGEAPLAEKIYTQLFETRTLPWAQLGLAKTQYLQGRFDDAEKILQALLVENVRYMDAYDWLAKIHEAMGDLAQAQKVLESAVAVSPHAVRRLRKLGEVAIEVGDAKVAEKAFKQVVSKGKYSEFRNPEDHVRLVQALISAGDSAQAKTVIRDLEKSMGDSKKMPACRAISAALVHEYLGDKDRTATELRAAVEASGVGVGLSGELKMTLAKNCLSNNFDEGAAQVMLDVMNNASSDEEMAKAASVFELAGRPDLAESTAKESKRQVGDLVSSGADKARHGDYQGAVGLMLEALNKLPGNPQVVFNGAVAILKYLENLGWDDALGKQCRSLIENARRMEPTNPRIAMLADLYQQILRKYGMS